jgi:hypothetical protein
MLMGGFGGMAGYVVYALLSRAGWPADAGAASVVLIEAVGRLVLSDGRMWNPDATAYYREQGPSYWLFQNVNCLAMALVTAILLKSAGPAFYGIGFSISAVLLIFGYAGDGQKVPTTHQITNVVGVAMGLTGGNVAVSVAFGMFANMIYLLFAKYFNENCSTHVDPPAVAIEVTTLVMGLIF